MLWEQNFLIDNQLFMNTRKIFSSKKVARNRKSRIFAAANRKIGYR